MNQQGQARQPRENRQGVVLDAAAALFSKKGYEGTSMRDIATVSGLLAGSIYCHFSSKQDIFLCVQREGIRQLTEAVNIAIDGIDDPWQRLETACATHAKVLLDESDFAAVLLHVTPSRNLDVWDQLATLRDEYEIIFRQLVDDLPLIAGASRKYLRLAILGALNWSHHWYRPGQDDPAEIAAQIIRLFENQLRKQP